MFIESIKIQNARIALADLHLKRIQATQQKIYGKITIQDLNIDIPQPFHTGLVKCRLTYHHNLLNIEFEKYQAKAIKRLKIVEDPALDYSLKYANRSHFERIKKLYDKYSDIIITQQGYLTDSSYSNLVLYDGLNYITPKTYLLNGVQRQYLLASKTIQEKNIHISELQNYHTLFLINAMLSWSNKIAVPISNIDS